jgi:molybdopterin-guanine dinucleotide biosynthesis protein A
VTASASAIVVAGGKSSRLGQDKRQLRLTSSRTLLEETIERLSALSDDVVVVGSDLSAVAGPSIRFVADPLPGAGPLNGLYGGLSAVQNEYAVAVACDLPFLSVRLLRVLVDYPRDYDLLVPRRADGTLEMLQAVYRKTCLDAMRRRLSVGRLKLSGLVEDVRVRFVDEVELIPYDPELRSFLNVNTPRDLATIKSLLL